MNERLIKLESMTFTPFSSKDNDFSFKLVYPYVTCTGEN